MTLLHREGRNDKRRVFALIVLWLRWRRWCRWCRGLQNGRLRRREQFCGRLGSINGTRVLFPALAFSHNLRTLSVKHNSTGYARAERSNCDGRGR